MQKAVAIKIKMENAGGAAKQSRPSTSELAAKLSETISDEDRERFDRDARTGQLTGERLKEGPRPSGGKGSLGFQTVEKSVAKSISTADKEKWDAANLREREENAKGLNNLPLLRMAALAGETSTVEKAKLRLLLELIEAIGKVMPPETHKVTMIGSSAHGLGIRCSDLDISVTPSGKTPGGYGDLDIGAVDLQLAKKYNFVQELITKEKDGVYKVKYSKEEVTNGQFLINIIYGNRNADDLTEVFQEYAKHFLVKALCRIVYCWAKSNKIMGETELNGPTLFIMAIKTAILNGLDSVRGTKNEEVVLKDLKNEPMMEVVDPEIKTAEHEKRLGQLVLQFFERLWEEDLGKVIFEIESDELKPRRKLLKNALVEVQEPIGRKNVAEGIYNAAFVAVIRQMAEDAWGDLKEEKTPESLNLRAEGSLLDASEVEKFRTVKGDWSAKKKRKAAVKTKVKKQ